VGLHNLKPAKGSTRSRKRVGRGPGSGMGKTATRGEKGQKSRSGYRHREGFEGGQMPLHRRVPKRGFGNARFRMEFACVNLGSLERFEAGTIVTPELLREKRLVRKLKAGVKVLGKGTLTKVLTVQAHRFSAQAQERITGLGGKAEVIAS
jgi:large subunit ribosomal protein L15